MKIFGITNLSITKRKNICVRDYNFHTSRPTAGKNPSSGHEIGKFPISFPFLNEHLEKIAIVIKKFMVGLSFFYYLVKNTIVLSEGRSGLPSGL
jgi:hypothetical protein